MQSGIIASPDLQREFASFLSNPSLRGLLVSISKSPEELVPVSTIPSTSSDFSKDLDNLTPHIKENVALYVILRQEGKGGDGGVGSCVAVTYVPDKAPVRQKMLFASTRLTLVRELGTEHFPQTLFCTLPSELTAQGWAKHVASTSVSAPLTQEEQNLIVIRETEALESTGTSARRGGHASVASSGVSMPLDDDARSAMEKLSEGDFGVVVLGIDVTREAMFLDTTAASGTKPDEVSGHISKTAPRYTFFAYTSQPEIKVLFIYTCPGVSKVKERMLYAANRNAVIHTVAPELGVKLEKRMEAGGPEDLDGGVVAEECGLGKGGESAAGEEATPAVSGAGAGRGFARPKRPGKK